MPLIKSKSKRALKQNFRELGRGKTYSRTKRKSGKRAANRQRVAIALSNQRKYSRR